MFKASFFRRLTLILIDLACFIAIFTASFVISEFFSSTSVKLDIATSYYITGAIFGGLLLAARMVFSVYTNVWRYANSKAYLTMVFSDIVGGAAALLVSYALDDYSLYMGVWQSVTIVALYCLATLTLRFGYQQSYRHFNLDLDYINKIGVAIVGAGQVGTLLAEELKFNATSHYRPICFIDKSADKIGGKIADLRVYKEDESVIEKIKDLPVQEIFIALPKIDGATAKKLLDFYSRTGCKVKLYDFPINQLEGEENSKRVLRPFNIEDLLFRDALKLTDSGMNTYYEGKTVLVTGGGGSIGSELCRQVAKRKPKKLIILDIYENNAYEIQQELIRKYHDKLDLCVEIASVRDPDRLDAIFNHYKPDIVFHAAAHKHVPLMEHSSCEAIKNNVFGTYNVANASEKHSVKRFILISTDKAVNPTNIMGATKRLCEMVVQCRNNSNTSFSCVRFGNVLGSNGSVIPLFKAQIEKGGPITITDKRIIRYFMTIPEAAQLVMEAGFLAERGELFVLDMGKPIKIMDLAENMIKLSGFRPYEDIDIVEVGLRPGEKLYEELLIKTETLDKTENNLIFIEHDQPLSRQEVDKKLTALKRVIESSKGEISSEKIKKAMKKAIPTYHDPDEVNCKAEESEEMNNTKDVSETVNA
ncbi:MAG: polysaccharide biosynthesis protein [Clostridia bacterium]|nr:polysaccharide biosynthesis protein [Clostridia bacterium]